MTAPTDPTAPLDPATGVVDPANPDQPGDKPAETDWKAQAREWEKRAKANKQAADRLAELEDAKKSAEQKAAERLAATEAELAKIRRDALRERIARKHSLPDDLAEVLSGDDEDAMTEHATRLAKYAAPKDAPSLHGGPRTPAPAGDDMNQLIRRQLGRS